MPITYDKVQDLSATVVVKFQKGLEEYNPVYKDVAPTIASSGAATIYPLGRVPEIIEWVGERKVKEIGEAKYMLENKLYEGTIRIPRTAIEDDNYGFYIYQATALAKEAKQHPDRLLSDAIMKAFSTGLSYDGVSFFNEEHPFGPSDSKQSNLQSGTSEPWVILDASKAMPAFFYQLREDYKMEKPADLSEGTFMKDEYLFGVRGRGNIGYGLWQLAYGSKAELTKANFENAMKSMLKLKKFNGNAIGAMPTHIIVGPENYTKALELFKTIYQSSSSNVWYERVKIVMLPWLEADATPPAGGDSKSIKADNSSLKVDDTAESKLLQSRKLGAREQSELEIVSDNGTTKTVKIGEIMFDVASNQVRPDNTLTDGGISKYNIAKESQEGSN